MNIKLEIKDHIIKGTRKVPHPQNPNLMVEKPFKEPCESDPHLAVITLPMPGKIKDKTIEVGCNSLDEALSALTSQLYIHKQDLLLVLMEKPKATPKSPPKAPKEKKRGKP